MPTWMDSIDNRRPHGEAARLSDFTTSFRVVPISLLVVAGVLSAFLAVGLVRLIGLFTNLFFQRWETGLIAPGAEATR
jgi:chloride channel protein, CIC family